MKVFHKIDPGAALSLLMFVLLVVSIIGTISLALKLNSAVQPQELQVQAGYVTIEAQPTETGLVLQGRTTRFPLVRFECDGHQFTGVMSGPQLTAVLTAVWHSPGCRCGKAADRLDAVAPEAVIRP